MIGEQYMKAAWARYADLLKETIGPVYRQLQMFTNNVNNYFLGVTEEEDQQGRKQYADDAIEDAEKLAIATTNAVAKIEDGGPPPQSMGMPPGMRETVEPSVQRLKLPL